MTPPIKFIAKTNLVLAEKFYTSLFKALHESLSDTLAVLDIVSRTRAHAPAFPESRFCKGCVLPVVDTVATNFFTNECDLNTRQIRQALRCEGVTTLNDIYNPSIGQSGFGGATWGKNFQPYDKRGKPAKAARGYQPGPDFGIVHQGATKFSMLGETKFKPDSSRVGPLHEEVRRDLKYYVGLPCEPEKEWDYDFGFGIAYAGGGAGFRKSYLATDDWLAHRFVVACFHG
jgi:hypothetical protein